MPHWDFQRNVASMRLMAEYASDQGVCARDCLAGTGVRHNQLADPERVVAAEQELRMARNLVGGLGHVVGLGVGAGIRYHFTTFGALGFAIVSSRSGRSALDVALQYFHLTSAFTRFVVSDIGPDTRVLLEDHGIPEDIAPFLVERDAAALITVARDLYGTEPILRGLELRAPRPADVEPYRAALGVRPSFGAAQNLVVLDRARLERPLVQANEPARLAAIKQCRLLLESRRTRQGMAAEVRDRLVTGSPQMPTMEHVAAELCMTARTLRRRLTEERTSFAELRDEVRKMLADELLTGPRLSIEQIGERLGYDETASFIRAFKRWHGRTPHAFRLAGGALPR